MNVAFYAPLKPPGHARPSGDRTIARGLLAALRAGGHQVEIAARLCTRDPCGDRGWQRRVEGAAARLAVRLTRRFLARSPASRPQLWFSYHSYYRAPDLLGPVVSRRLAIPYVVAEASHAPKRASGVWAEWHRRAACGIEGADLVIATSSDDLPGLRRLVVPSRLVHLKPFLGAMPPPASGRAAARAQLARELWLDPGACWLLAVAMMRPGRKLASYGLLARALTQLQARPWRLLVVGDGPAEPAVRAVLGRLGARVVFAGVRSGRSLQACYRAADLLVWPAVEEPLGMVLLESQAAGLPVVAGCWRGVPDLVEHGRGGLLTAPGDVDALAAALASLIDDPERRRAMGAAARLRARREHSLERATSELGRWLARLDAESGPEPGAGVAGTLAAGSNAAGADGAGTAG